MKDDNVRTNDGGASGCGNRDRGAINGNDASSGRGAINGNDASSGRGYSQPTEFDLGESVKNWAEQNSIPHHYMKTVTSTNDWVKKITELKPTDLKLTELKPTDLKITDLKPTDLKLTELKLTDLKPTELKEFSLFITSWQSHGRGRGKNNWQEVSKGSHLATSWVYRLSAPPHPSLSPKIGWALQNALKKNWGDIPWALKSPNDIYVHEKKIAGILIENITEAEKNICIIGVGLNVWATPLDSATSLKNVLPIEHLTPESVFSFLTHFKQELDKSLQNFDKPLSSDDCLNIKQALNQLPSLKENPVIEVLADGSLRHRSGVVPWLEI